MKNLCSKILSTTFLFGACEALGFSISMPVNGCSIYSPRLLPYFDNCADFSAVNGRAGCTKTKGPCPLCTTYPGDHLQMWLPDFVVEVTSHFGRSIFAESLAGATLNEHLKAATSWSTGSSGQVPLFSNGSSYQTSHSMFWHVRILPLPFGKPATTFFPLSASRGVGVPTCYSGLSELIPGQWNYGLSDMPAAGVLAPLIIPICFPGAGGLTTGLGVNQSAAGTEKINESVSTKEFPKGCALPIPASVGLSKNMSPTSDVWNPSKLCIGTLGNLIPRTGLVAADDPYKAALIAGVKFASLTGDHFGDSTTGGWETDDKWQLVYPPSPHAYCAKPGSFSQALEMPAGVTEDPLTRGIENIFPSSKSGIYVFLVWRKRTSCQEPANAASGGTFWRTTFELNRAKNLGLCATAQIIP